MADPRTSHPNADKAAGYTRLSEMARSYDAFSPENQRRMNQEAARREGKTLVREYSDLDIPASKKEVRRPAYEAMVEALIKQDFQTLYVPTMDRLSRLGMGHVGLLLDRIDEVGGRIVFIADHLDSWQPGARQVIAMRAEQARGEIEQMRWRIEQWHAWNRRNGRWVHNRQYGIEIVDFKLRPHPVEGPVALDMIKDFHDGKSFRSIAARLNEEGVLPPRVAFAEEARARGRRAKEPTNRNWGYQTVKSVLTSPALAAVSLYEGKLVVDDDGEPIMFGQGLITLAERARILAEVERRTTIVRESRKVERVGGKTGGGRPAKYPVTGYAKCGLCARRMTAAGRETRPGVREHIYRCRAHITGQPCPGAMAQGRVLEAEVFEQFAAKLATLEPGDRLFDVIAERWISYTMPDEAADRKILQQALAEIDARIALLYEDRYERRKFDTAEDLAIWERMITRAKEQRSAIADKLNALGPAPQADIGFLRDTVASKEKWDATPVHRQRELLGLAISAVFVYPSEPGTAKRYLHDRIRIAWVDQDEEEVRQDSLRQLGWPVS
jgi:site-specific DNA recombinase